MRADSAKIDIGIHVSIGGADRLRSSVVRQLDDSFKDSVMRALDEDRFDDVVLLLANQLRSRQQVVSVHAR